jgi:hypothetical protein
MATLIRTPKPHSTESLFGFVLHVSEYNGYETPAYICETAQIRRGRELAAGFPVERLAQILGKDPPLDSTARAYTTFQGKEAEVLVLGAPNPQSAGARRWAGNPANLLNVAVSRAQRRLYVIGSRKVWRDAGEFRVLNASL